MYQLLTIASHRQRSSAAITATDPKTWQGGRPPIQQSFVGNGGWDIIRQVVKLEGCREAAMDASQILSGRLETWPWVL